MHINILDIFISKPFLAALIAQMSSQIFKIFMPLFRGKKPDGMNFFSYGDFPSAHTAFIVAVAVSLGLTEGWNSSIFALGAVVASIVIYDILKLRTALEITIKYTKILLEKNNIVMDDTMPQFKGHSALEVVVGAAWGIFWAVVIGYLPIGK